MVGNDESDASKALQEMSMDIVNTGEVVPVDTAVVDPKYSTR